MSKTILGAVLQLTANVGKAAATAASDIWGSIDDTVIVYALNQAAEKFEPIIVPVTCRPTSADLDEYIIETDLSALEAALGAGRLVRPCIVVTAASSHLDRAVLTDKLIETFNPILVTHATRMEHLRKRREVRMEREQSSVTLSAMGDIFEFFINAAMLAMIGLGALIGPIMWLLIAFGGIAVLSELPRLTFNLFKEAIGVQTFNQPEDAEIHQMKKDLERYRPLLQKMVEKTTIIESAALAATLHDFTV